MILTASVLPAPLSPLTSTACDAPEFRALTLSLSLSLSLTLPLTLTLTRTRACMQFWDNKCDDDGICGVETFDDEA